MCVCVCVILALALTYLTYSQYGLTSVIFIIIAVWYSATNKTHSVTFTKFTHVLESGRICFKTPFCKSGNTYLHAAYTDAYIHKCIISSTYMHNFIINALFRPMKLMAMM